MRRHREPLTNTLLLVVLLRQSRTEIWMSGIMAVNWGAIMMPPRRTMSRIAKVGRPDNDDDPFETDFQKKADAFDTAFGDMPFMRRRDQDSGNQKNEE